MSEPFYSEIRMFGFAFNPRGWALCQGQVLSISQNNALFSLLGTTFGGNGTTTFALPDLRGRAPLHFGTGTGQPTYALGQSGGERNHTLLATEMPTHNHIALAATATADRVAPAGSTWAASPQNPYSTSAPNTALAASAIMAAGGSQSHSNESPYMVVNFSIALSGLFPPRS